MPAAPTPYANLIVYDVSRLQLPVAEAQAIENVLRDVLIQELAKRNLGQNRSAIDLSTAVVGIAID